MKCGAAGAGGVGALSRRLRRKELPVHCGRRVLEVLTTNQGRVQSGGACEASLVWKVVTVKHPVHIVYAVVTLYVGGTVVSYRGFQTCSS